MTVLLDTSVLTRVRTPSIRVAINQLAASQPLARSALTDLDIGFSARTAAEHDELAAALAAFDLVPIVPPRARRALQVQRLLADRGLRGRKVPDLLIAAAAEARAMTLAHYHRDFDHIADVTGQRVQWIVPRGTID